MNVIAKVKYLRISPRKVRLVADLIRGKKVEQAKALLDFSLKKAAKPLRKLLDQALANAKNNYQLKEDTLWISKITVDEGPKLKRWRARARGRAGEIQKKTSHIILVLSGEKEKKTEWKKEEQKTKQERKERKKEEKIKPYQNKLKEKETKPTKIKILSEKIFRRKAM